MQIRLMIDGVEMVVDTAQQDAKGKTQKDREMASARKNREIPSKRSTKRRSRQKHQSDWHGTGPGANTVRGYRAAVGDVKAIAAEETGCIAYNPGSTIELRLRIHMTATTDPKNDGMRYTDGKGARRAQ